MARKEYQSYPDGAVYIYAETNTAEPGAMPVKTLTLKGMLRYEQRSLTALRYYPNVEAQNEVTHLLRTPYVGAVTPLDIAVPNDGKKYRIVQVLRPQDKEGCMDLTLTMLDPEE